METLDISKIRRFALAIALILTTLVLAEVEIETPVRIAPLGFPLIIRSPDLLTRALVIASVYAILRYIYYGMLAQPSPMRTRRILLSGKTLHTPSAGINIEEFAEQAEKEVERYFPMIGNQRVNFQAIQDHAGCHIEIKVPPIVRAVCWIENLDFLLPIFANILAIALWSYGRMVAANMLLQRIAICFC